MLSWWANLLTFLKETSSLMLRLSVKHLFKRDWQTISRYKTRRWYAVFHYTTQLTVNSTKIGEMAWLPLGVTDNLILTFFSYPSSIIFEKQPWTVQYCSNDPNINSTENWLFLIENCQSSRWEPTLEYQSTLLHYPTLPPKLRSLRFFILLWQLRLKINSHSEKYKSHNPLSHLQADGASDSLEHSALIVICLISLFYDSVFQRFSLALQWSVHY